MSEVSPETWTVFDLVNPIYDENDYVTTTCSSSEELEQLLQLLVQRLPPTMALVDAYRLGKIRLGLSPNVCSVEWFPQPGSMRSRLAIASVQSVAEPVTFIMEGHPTVFPPSQLFRTDEVVRMLLHLYTNGSFPDEVVWLDVALPGGEGLTRSLGNAEQPTLPDEHDDIVY